MAEEGAVRQKPTFGKPKLVCRWRISAGTLPAANRHLRAFGARSIEGEHFTRGLVAWVKQHIEWTLADGASRCPDGVLMVMVDERGRAAMAVGAYEPLPSETLAALVARAQSARREAQETDVAPEVLWAVRSGGLVCGLGGGERSSGATSLVYDLAQTLGMSVSREPNLAELMASSAPSFDEAFLVSDEHGVVVASDAAGPCGVRFRDGWEHLLASSTCGGSRRARP